MEESQALGFWQEPRKKQKKKWFHSIPEIQLEWMGNKSLQKIWKDTHKPPSPKNKLG